MFKKPHIHILTYTYHLSSILLYFNTNDKIDCKLTLLLIYYLHITDPVPIYLHPYL